MYYYSYIQIETVYTVYLPAEYTNRSRRLYRDPCTQEGGR